MLLQLGDVTFGYPGTEIFAGLTLQVNPGDRIGLVGPNGAGKSTALRLMSGALKPELVDVEISIKDDSYPWFLHWMTLYQQSQLNATRAAADDAGVMKRPKRNNPERALPRKERKVIAENKAKEAFSRDGDVRNRFFTLFLPLEDHFSKKIFFEKEP